MTSKPQNLKNLKTSEPNSLLFESITLRPEPLSPLQFCSVASECLPGDWLAYGYLVVLAAGIACHLPWQEYQADIELHSQLASQPLHEIEEAGVASVEIHGDYVSAALYALSDAALAPLNVLHSAGYPTRAEASGDTQQLCVSVCVCLGKLLHIAAFLLAHSVDRQEYGAQGLNVIQDIVDYHPELRKLLAEQGDVRDAVETAEGVIAHHHVSTVGCDVFHASYGIGHPQIFAHGYGEVCPLVHVTVFENIIELALTDYPFYQSYDESWHLCVERRCFLSQHLGYIYSLHGSFGLN